MTIGNRRSMPPPRQAAAADPADTGTQPARVLLVNDRADQLLALATMLEPLGLVVVTVDSGPEALRRLLQEDFAVMVLDVHMPGMDGFEIAEAIRQRPRSELTPIIFATATNFTEPDRVRGYETGAFDYVQMPIDPVILRAKVAAFVRMHEMNAQLKRQAEELAELNRHLHQQTFQLEAVNQELEAFSYSVSHDLRAPLRRIEQFSGLLGEEHAEQLNDDARHLIGRIRDNTARMGQLIDDLLTLSKVTRANLAPVNNIDLSVIADTVLQALRQQEPARMVEARITPALITRGDPGLLRVLLENLIGNAWKYTGKRAIARIEVGVTVNARHPRAFFVRDNGAGFDMAFGDRLFAPFQRLHHDGEFPGNGVGLSIAARIVTRHGGSIWAESAVDQGATFYFTLE
jgi:hypothetical protein